VGGSLSHPLGESEMSEAYCYECMTVVAPSELTDDGLTCVECFALLSEGDWEEHCIFCHEPLAELVVDEDGDSYAICAGCAYTKADGQGTLYPDDQIP